MSRRVRIYEPMPEAQASLYRQILEDAGVDAEVVPGAVPGLGAVLLVPEEQLPLVEVALAQAAKQAEGTRGCPACGELSPATFLWCWSCGASLEGKGDDAQTWEEPAAPKEGSVWVVVATGVLLVLGAVGFLLLERL